MILGTFSGALKRCWMPQRPNQYWPSACADSACERMDFSAPAAHARPCSGETRLVQRMDENAAGCVSGPVWLCPAFFLCHASFISSFFQANPCDHVVIPPDADYVYYCAYAFPYTTFFSLPDGMPLVDRTSRRIA